jgi:hypothetical protein
MGRLLRHCYHHILFSYTFKRRRRRRTPEVVCCHEHAAMNRIYLTGLSRNQEDRDWIDTSSITTIRNFSAATKWLVLVQTGNFSLRTKQLYRYQRNQGSWSSSITTIRNFRNGWYWLTQLYRYHYRYTQQVLSSVCENVISNEHLPHQIFLGELSHFVFINVPGTF